MEAFFLSIHMPVIALAPLIVISKQAAPTDNISEAILESMRRWRNGSRHPPDDHFGQPAIRIYNALADEQFSLHDGVLCHHPVVT
jgi:hypothetical protein